VCPGAVGCAELLTAVEQNTALCWPFLKPVDTLQALDYYDVIIDPIDLSLMRSRLGCQQYYVSLEMFVADLRKMCDNCRWGDL
jgi:histone acetyltransferase